MFYLAPAPPVTLTTTVGEAFLSLDDGADASKQVVPALYNTQPGTLTQGEYTPQITTLYLEVYLPQVQTAGGFSCHCH